MKIPEQIKRLSVVFLGFIILIFIIRVYIIPAPLKEKGFQRKTAIENEISKEILYAGAIICSECHEEIKRDKDAGYHKPISCETCHGPAQKHTENPTEIKPIIPRERYFCQQCHTYNPSRPTGFPQINPNTHNPVKPCISCHNSHDPKPPYPPKKCSACHNEIFKTKELSHHAYLDCNVCHNAPDKHKINPRTFKASKPNSRKFCGKCHSVESNIKETPKIDIVNHGERYLCWQCHYPHMPGGF